MGEAKRCHFPGKYEKYARLYLKKCNDLRKLNGRSELLITDYMMAVAQYDTNASAYTMNHLAHFAVGENLAWGYTTPDSVFGGWYDQEKEQYEKDRNAAAAGHYFNIINAGYKVTGFALNQYALTVAHWSDIFVLALLRWIYAERIYC